MNKPGKSPCPKCGKLIKHAMGEGRRHLRMTGCAGKLDANEKRHQAITPDPKSPFPWEIGNESIEQAPAETSGRSEDGKQSLTRHYGKRYR